MDVFFSDNKIKKICEDEKLLYKEFGKDNAKKIMRRLNELYSVENLSMVPSVPPPRRHILKGERHGQFAVDIKHPFRIVFIPLNDPLPTLESGGIDLEKITKIKIIFIGDYHGE